MATLTQYPSWQTLCQHQKQLEPMHMRDMFKENPKRFEQFSLILDDLLLDYSKHRLTKETLDLLFQIAREAKIENWRDRMFSGEKINITEDRAVLHTALRNRSNTPVYVNGKDVMPDVNAVLTQMREFTTKVRDGSWTGYTDKPITDIVNIGIGGSDLGPVMVCDALKPYAS
ncbi:MAG TPA: glucose-6-phosphate isomerase, partial [Methylophilaceae bacterium]|nr:glucose-6-phosphate isomerase [Methylophilaceae bacterium]